MPGLIWTPHALHDIERLHRFLVSRDRDAARRAIATIRSSIRQLAAHPDMGRPMEEMPPGFREWPIRFGRAGYLALYRIDAGRVVILAIRHSREAGYSS